MSGGLIDHAQRKHALCSASGAERWLNCPGSVGLSQGIPEGEPSKWALEGTRCHELAETILQRWLASWKDAGYVRGVKVDYDWVDAELRPQFENTIEEGSSYSMVDYALTYVHVVLEELEDFDFEPRPPAALVEQRLVFDEGMAMFGTADFIATGVRHGVTTGLIVDLKYGKGKRVVAENNLQLQYYAVALRKCSKKSLERVRVVIVQPRLPEFYTTVEYNLEELKAADEKLLLGAEKAMWQAAYPETRTLQRGPWCQWCPAKKVCPEILAHRAAKDIALFSETIS